MQASKLTSEEKWKLRNSGWTVIPDRGQGPPSVDSRNVLQVGDHVRVASDSEVIDPSFVDLATMV